MLILSLLGVLIVNPKTQAVTQEPNTQQNLFEMTIEELMEVPVVVSASRQAQKIGQSSAPVSVITAEDIHYSGLTSIPEILQFYPGVDMLRLDRHRWSVGVRGLHDFISDRTLVLINGRATDIPIYGGTMFDRMPIFLEDIERIEIVRGPGSAAWGANALTGVINIITKKPEDIPGGLATTTITEFGDTYTHLRYAQKKDKLSWRVSAGYEDLESSDDAGAGKYLLNGDPLVADPLIGFSGYQVRDYMRNQRFDTEAFYDFTDQTCLSLGAAYSRETAGSWEFMGYYPDKNTTFHTLRTYSKLEHKFDDGNWYLQWYRNYDKTDMPQWTNWRSSQDDIEGQLDFDLSSSHKVTLGGNVRFVRIDIDADNPLEINFKGEPLDEQFAGLFLIDRWTVNDRWTIEGQVRGDWYSQTQTDWATRWSAFYTVDEQKEHILRFSTARAFRTPFIALRGPVASCVPVGPDTYLYYILPAAEDLKNEETFSLEAGYTGKLSKHLILRADTYYQRFSRLIGYDVTYDDDGWGYNRAGNIDGADSWGSELELILEGKPGRISAWYAYNDFQAEESHQPLRAYMPAMHKVGLRGRWYLPAGWAVNANYRYTGTTTTTSSNDSLLDVGTEHRLDLTITKEFAGGNGEVMFGVSDVLNSVTDPHLCVGPFTAHETPGRMFFGRIQLKF